MGAARLAKAKRARVIRWNGACLLFGRGKHGWVVLDLRGAPGRVLLPRFYRRSAAMTFDASDLVSAAAYCLGAWATGYVAGVLFLSVRKFLDML